MDENDIFVQCKVTIRVKMSKKEEKNVMISSTIIVKGKDFMC